MTFKDKASIIIYNIFGIELSVNIDKYGINGIVEDENYVKIHGELFYCGRLLEGHILVTEDFINDLIKKISFKLNVIKDNIAYTKIEEDSLTKLRKLKLYAEFITIENFNPEINDDEFEDDYDEDKEYLFLKIKSLKQ